MKKTILTLLPVLVCLTLIAQDTTSQKFNDTLMLENVEINAIRAADRAPFTKTNISKVEIEKSNSGRDLPFLLQMTPSLIVNSDAGNGVGYTNLRIRGSDASRINVTLNGIPYNDAESQGTFFVDMPDIASSLNSIQIQRGVGTSSNGAGSFGATINLSTHEFNKEKYLEADNSYGSFNTWKHTLKAGTGLIKKHFLLDARVSKISSDGYIDRASSDLKSFYISGAYVNEKSSLRFNVISGKEKTYQAWNGVPQNLLKTDRTYNSSGTEKPGKPYANETDNYTQTHYQLFFNHKWNRRLSFNTALFLTRGKGYYENYKAGEDFEDYFLPDFINQGDTLTSTDLVVQDWLDNYFYGGIFSLQYHRKKTHITFGGGYSNYDGGHYNIVKWAQYGIKVPYKYIDNPSNKNDLNLYLKWMQTIKGGFTAFVDIQQRLVHININGFEDHPDMNIRDHYAFFNPKVGLSFNRSLYHAYLSLSLGTKEPNRDDFEAGGINQPKSERLFDWELGFGKKGKSYSYEATLYYMKYRNQLVNTGKINDVGAYTRTNADNSYRAGIELQGGWMPIRWLSLSGNIAFSSNKIQEFTEYIDDYDAGGQKINHYSNIDISFSPATVAAASITVVPIKNGNLSFLSKYVSRQFLDNTSNADRALPSYFVENAQLSYTFTKLGIFREITGIFNVYNLFDEQYESNGYTFGYISGGKHEVENYYFPMAGINFMVGIKIRL